MFDLFGIEKVDAKESICQMAKGVTIGLLEGYEYRIQEKDMEIKKLKEKVESLEKEIKNFSDGEKK